MRIDIILMMCGFDERSPSKIKPRLRVISENVISVLQRESVCGSRRAVLVKEAVMKWITSVVPSCSLSLFSSIHKPTSATQS